MEREFFGQVEDVLRTLVSSELGDVRTRSHRSGVKVWFGTEKAARFHYEAQLLDRKHVDGGKGAALEIGFHAEERDTTKNEQVLASLMSRQEQWRPQLGQEAEAGEFFGAQNWRRLSDVWLDPELTEDDAAFEVGARLADYVNALQDLVGLADHC